MDESYIKQRSESLFNVIYKKLKQIEALITVFHVMRVSRGMIFFSFFLIIHNMLLCGLV